MRVIVKSIVLAMCVSWLLLSALGGCVAPIGAPAPDLGIDNGEPDFVLVANDYSPGDFEPIADDGTHVDNQVILIGLSENIDFLDEQLRQRDYRVERMATVRMDFLSSEGLQLVDPYREQTNQVEIVLFELDVPDELREPDGMRSFLYGTLYPELIMEGIRTGRLAPVFAELNYVIAPPDVGGNGNSVGAHPAGAIDGPGIAGEFLAQWALVEPPGIGLYDGNIAGTRLISPTGQGVDIVVFDSSPFATNSVEVVPLGEIHLSGNNGSHMMSVVNSVPFGLPVLNSRPYSASHGLFVLGLAHAVAPGADVELVRVLDENMQGNVFQLVDAMVAVMRQRMSQDGQLTKDTVFNLSLGARQDRTLDDLGLDETTLEFLETYLEPNEPKVPVFALKTVAEIARSLNIIVVASSGNQTLATESSPRPAEFPAIYPTVLGVTASTSEGMRGCYANEGDVFAPGGHGGCGVTVTIGTEFDSSYGLLSVVLSPTASADYAYYYWSGTSFAAPLVSGLAALALETGDAPTVTNQILSGSCTPSSNSPSGVDVVHVNAVLNGICP